MTEMTTNNTDHSSEIEQYSWLPSTWLATAKYANVKTPVAAIPTARIRAPRASPSGRAPAGSLAAKAHEQHRPGERRARLDHAAVARQQRHEAALGPVVEVPGRVAEVLPVR